MRAQQGASEGESDTGFPFFMSDFFMPDARRPAAPDVGNTGYLISEAYAAGSPVCLTPVSGERPMFGHPMPVVCRIADSRSVCGWESEAPGGGVWGRIMPDAPNPDAGRCPSRRLLRQSWADLLPVAVPETARRHTNRAVNPLM